MRDFVKNDGINKQSCFFMQTLTGAGDITTSYPNKCYATFLDSFGSILFVSALASERIDKDKVTQATDMFVQAIRYAYKPAASGQQPLSGAFLTTLEKHRSQARRALGLTGE
jgi:hypothetical protein